jgi:hypothetical protein
MVYASQTRKTQTRKNRAIAGFLSENRGAEVVEKSAGSLGSAGLPEEGGMENFGILNQNFPARIREFPCTGRV